ncbi:condensation domain-containing protein, partial [Streptomyces sp. NPDC056638]|uniref:condensation domain-containing protein n=1 Tax=Streptomyces sp. NPDC056638 TaxID=3345887 RepID=UPI0036B6C804
MGVWVAQQLAADSPLYNCATYFEISGRVDAALLTEAVRRTVAETDALRVRFTEDGDGLWQVIEPVGEKVRLAVLDVSAESDPTAAARAWMAADLATPTELSSDSLYTHALFRTGTDRSLLYFRHHHIVLDGFGQAVYCSRLAQTYTALAGGQEPPVGRFRKLAEIVDEERAYHTSARHDADRDYWHAAFEELPEPAPLAGRNSAPSPTALRRAVRLTADQEAQLAGVGRWSAVLVAAVAAYLHRLTGSDDVVVGLAMTARTTPLAVSTPAMLANDVPLRLDVQGGNTLAELVDQVMTRLGGALRHQRYRSEDLVHHLGLSGGAGALGSAAVNAVSFGKGIRFGDHDTVMHPLSSGPVKDLAVSSYGEVGSAGGVVLEFAANPAVYTETELAGQQDRFLRFLSTLAADPHRSIGGADLLDEAERERLVSEWNDSARVVPQAGLAELFEERVRLAPAEVAVEYGELSLTYQELNESANRLARHLIGLGVGPERIVAVALPRSVEWLVGMLAVAKAGGTYLPVDPEYPVERIRYMLADASPVCVVT